MAGIYTEAQAAGYRRYRMSEKGKEARKRAQKNFLERQKLGLVGKNKTKPPDQAETQILAEDDGKP